MRSLELLGRGTAVERKRRMVLIVQKRVPLIVASFISNMPLLTA